MIVETKFRESLNLEFCDLALVILWDQVFEKQKKNDGNRIWSCPAMTYLSSYFAQFWDLAIDILWDQTFEQQKKWRKYNMELPSNNLPSYSAQPLPSPVTMLTRYTTGKTLWENVKRSHQSSPHIQVVIEKVILISTQLN